MVEKLLNVNDVADVLGVSARSVYRLVESGSLAGLHIRTSLRFTEAQVEAYQQR